MTIREVLGTSAPALMTVVETKMPVFPAAKEAIAASFFFGRRLPPTIATERRGKTCRFTDINYKVASREDKTAQHTQCYEAGLRERKGSKTSFQHNLHTFSTAKA